MAGTLRFLKAFKVLSLLEITLIPHLEKGMKMYILLFYFDNQRMPMTWYPRET